MPSRLPVPASDINVWGLCYNDAHYPIIGQAQFNVVLNANNPPTVQAGTKFYIFNETTFTTAASPVTGNNVYPAATSVNNLQNTGVIFELVDRTFTWATGNFPTKVNSTTYYLHCSAAEDIDPTSRGRGVYGASTTAPTWNEIKQGWYSADGRVIAKFYVDGSGNVCNLLVLDQDVLGYGFIDSATATSFNLNMAARSAFRVNYGFIPSAGGQIGIFVNGDTTNVNYNSVFTQYYGTSISVQTINDSYLSYFAANFTSGNGILQIALPTHLVYNGIENRYDPSYACVGQGFYMNNPNYSGLTSISSIEIFGTTNAFASGSWIILKKT